MPCVNHLTRCALILIILLELLLPAQAQGQDSQPTSAPCCASDNADSITIEKKEKELCANRFATALGATYMHNRSYWGTQDDGFFVSGRVDLGIYFFRPRVSLGYGKAHWRWIGIETNPIISGEGIGIYSGLRAALPFVDIRIGGRYRWTFQRSYLRPQYRFTREDIEDTSEERSTYLSWEAELTGGLPLWIGSLQTELGITAITGVPDEFFVYEETLRVVAKAPWVWRALFGYGIAFLKQSALRVALVAQLVGIPGRDEILIRAGLTARFRLSYNLELRGTFLPAVRSRDDLGLAGGDTYQIGLRYLWAYGPF